MMMGGKHVDMNTLTDYLLDRLSLEEEAAVQEHLCECPECGKKVKDIRNLRKAFQEPSSVPAASSLFTRVIRSSWTKAAAAIAIIAGGSILFINYRHHADPLMQQEILNGRQEDQTFAIDTFDREDSIYYMEKYPDARLGEPL